MVRLGEEWQFTAGEARQGAVVWGLAWLGTVRYGTAGMARWGDVRHGKAGKVRYVRAGQGTLRFGRCGKARSGKAWRGEAWCVKAGGVRYVMVG